MESRNSTKKEQALPLPALRILAPPMRLLSAAMWQVMQRKDALHYGKLEEFVTSVSEAVPGLLSDRHRAKLTLGLRARLILELCRGQDPPDPALILPHLRRIQPPLCNGRRDRKVESASMSFQQLVGFLLRSPAERAHFFQEEVFLAQYGPGFDSALEKLLWEFLSRLDQLLPVPDLAQTVLWLSNAPGVLEDYEQPALLSTLREHQQRLGHLDTASSLRSSVGDCILSSLSLPPSSRVCSTNSLGQSGTGPVSVSPASLMHQANRRPGRSSPIQPVIGLITNQDLPLTRSNGKKGAETAQAMAVIGRGAESGAKRLPRPLYTGVKVRSQGSLGGARQEGAERIEGRGGACDEGVGHMERRGGARQEGEGQMEGRGRACGEGAGQIEGRGGACGERAGQIEGRGGACGEGAGQIEGRGGAVQSKQRKQEEAATGGAEERAGLRKSERIWTERLSEVEAPTQEKVGLSALVISCLQAQPRVRLERLALPVPPSPRLPDSAGPSPWRPLPWATQAASPSPRREGGAGTRKRKFSSAVTPEKRQPITSEKENCADSPITWGASPVLTLSTSRGRHSFHSNCDDDVIVDSEDEEIKNVKGRLFLKRYYKTKNNTFIPTLREYWAPGLA